MASNPPSWRLTAHGRTVPVALALVAILAVWEYAGSHVQLVTILIGTPRRLLSFIASQHQKLLADTLATGAESLLGLVAALLSSSLVMILCLYQPRLLNLSLSLAVWSQVVPLVTLAPLFIIIFGFGLSSKVAMAALLAFFPTFIAFARGVAAVDDDIRDLLRIYPASKTLAIFRVFVPMSLPYLTTGVRVSSTLAVIGAVVGEFNGAEQGLGLNLLIASRRIAPELTVASILLSAAISAILYASVTYSEAALMPWHRSARTEREDDR